MSQAGPRTPRDLFDLFQRYDVSKGLDGLLDLIDWAGVTPHQIYWTVLQRWPEAARVPTIKPAYSPRIHASAALLADEFQKSVLRLAANAYPEKRRLIHVHIQKTAGDDLRKNLVARTPSLHVSMTQSEITTRGALFTALSEFSTRIQNCDSMYIGGHKEVNWYLNQSIYRFGDRMFTVIRHPYEIVISYINFILERFSRDCQMNNFETRNWAGAIGLDKLPDPMNSDDAFGIASKVLMTKTTVIRPNFLATYLGTGTVESARELMVRTNIEITDIERYNDWLKRTWGINSTTRSNTTQKRVTFKDFSNSQQAYIEEICREDLALYSFIRGEIVRRGNVCVSGAELFG